MNSWLKEIENIMHSYHIDANIAWSEVEDKVYTAEEFHQALTRMRAKALAAIQAATLHLRAEVLEAVLDAARDNELTGHKWSSADYRKYIEYEGEHLRGEIEGKE